MTADGTTNNTMEDSGATTPSDQKALRPSPSDTPTQSTLIKIVLARHSTRVFHPDRQVPMDVVEQCLELAQHSPSSTNMQPWRLTFTSGPRLERLRESMLSAVKSGQASTAPPIPDDYTRYRSELGHALYGEQGYNVARSDKEGTRKAQLRNYQFFDAPLVAVIGIDQALMRGSDIMSVGLYVQTLVLLLTEHGLDTCLEVSTAGYADVLRSELGIDDKIFVLSTLAIGYEDKKHHVNTFKMMRDQWRDHVDFVMD